MTALARISPEIHEPAPPISYAEPFGWYVVYSTINGEGRAKLGLDALGFPVCLPLQTKWHTRPGSRKRERVSRPLFPRYLFVGIDMSRPDWGEAKRVNGVEAILSFDGIPQRVPAKEIEKLQAKEAAGIFDRTRETIFATGASIKVDGGPLGDFVAEVERADDGKTVDVLHKFLGSLRRMKIDVARCVLA